MISKDIIWTCLRAEELRLVDDITNTSNQYNIHIYIYIDELIVQVMITKL